MKRLLSTVLTATLVLSLALTGCGKSASSTSKDNTASSAPQVTTNPQAEMDKPFTLRVGWWGSQTRHDKTLQAIELFKKKYPNAKVETEYASFDGYFDKLVTEAAGNNLPDVFQQDYAYLTPYSQKNLMEDLSGFVKDKVIDLSSVDEKQIEGGKIDNKLYAVSLGTNALAILYDPVLFQKAGIPVPSNTWTWDDFEKYSAQIKSKLGIYGAGDIPGYFKNYLRQYGATMYSADGKSLGYKDDKLFVDYYSRYLRMMQNKSIPSQAEVLEVKGIEDDFIVRGTSAMTSCFSNRVVATVNAAKKPLSLALLPNGDPGTKDGLYLNPSMFFSVSTNSKVKYQAAKFIDFFTNDVEVNKVLAAERGVPISSKVREALLPTLDDSSKQMFQYIGEVEKHSTKIDPPDPAGAAEVSALLKTIEDEILFGKTTPQDAAVKFRKQANDILAKAK